MTKKAVRTSLLIVTALYIASLGVYGFEAWQALQVRQQRIAASPTVYITQTGKKYHRPYHYFGRNSPVSLYEAVEQGYEACLICRPEPANITLIPSYYSHWAIAGLSLTGIYTMILLALLFGPQHPVPESTIKSAKAA